MKLSVELTLIPLKQDFVPPIKSFIIKLRNLGFLIKENPLSTQVYGDFDKLMEGLTPLIRKTFIEEDAVMLHIKMVKGQKLE